MNSAGAKITPYIVASGIQIIGGFAILIAEISGAALTDGQGSATGYMGYPIGIFYMITGILGIVAARSHYARCPMVASLVMSVFCILQAIGMMGWQGLVIAKWWGWLKPGVGGVIGSQLAFFAVVFTASIVKCVLVCRGLPDAAPYVQQVDQPGAYVTAGLPGQSPPGGMPYPG
ncbi:uncharacterized protein LOC129590057 [Paramacrobiotus metropolitanus]|uniref:uncharacterized protein LOC129590057 n=1 Tax=Paramacrobiotus metropolitanus TaxID=2943436 RepID=UPI00244655D1|nr:uncharacterized protein LOC129590057 [Paramacrobiotus metropolitanus]